MYPVGYMLSTDILYLMKRAGNTWAEMMGDSIMTTAFLGRLLHHVRLFKFNGEFYGIKSNVNQKGSGKELS